MAAQLRRDLLGVGRERMHLHIRRHRGRDGNRKVL
jgi:hypothetical protein